MSERLIYEARDLTEDEIITVESSGLQIGEAPFGTRIMLAFLSASKTNVTIDMRDPGKFEHEYNDRVCALKAAGKIPDAPIDAAELSDECDLDLDDSWNDWNN